ncbi:MULTISPECIES: hypothetical protein [unclassified Streptomyces]|uniref:hypothetical protein n=1 Tax=unclassified Streptomyces TaxID=2593676 RepID=UPI0022B6667B|nr:MULTISPECIES: hypothetical protein [unclassified Streptomyces]MCZ7416610.1 hypothetical protein [Streptomyces sp. WMMC897]MCZ7433577.1 hypothetical protein [Streptomyces sp. WMMC1477]
MSRNRAGKRPGPAVSGGKKTGGGTRPKPEVPEAESGVTAAERPTRVVVAAGLVALEGLVVLTVGVVMLALPFTGGRTDGTVQAVTGAVTVLALALLPLLTARGLWRLRRWSRGPAIFTQLLALPVGWQMGSGTGWWVACGLALAATSIAVLVCLFHSRAAAALGVETGRVRDADA